MKQNAQSVKKNAHIGGARPLMISLSRTAAHAAWAALLMLPVAAFAQNPVDWTVGDVFVASGNGNYQVWHSANPTNPSQNPYAQAQTISDGSIGATAGCAFDSAYRFFGTNFTNTKVDQYSIDATYGMAGTNGLVGQFTTGVTAGVVTSTLNESIAFDSQGSFFVGHAGGGKSLEKWTRALKQNSPVYLPYQLTNSWTPQVENSGVDWIDISSDGKTIYYTSVGRKIFTFTTLDAQGAGVQGLFADLGQPGLPNYALFALRLLPNGDVLVADKKNIKRVASGGSIVKTYDVSGQDDWESLSLDPNGMSFWAGDATTHQFYRLNIATGAVEAGPYTTGPNASLGGICVEGGFSAAQINAFPVPVPPAPTTKTFALTPTANTVVFTSPFTGAQFTLTLADLQNNLTATLRDSLVDPSVAQSDQNVFTLVPGSSGVSGALETNMPCDQTLTNNKGFQKACEIFEFETNPNTGFTIENMEVDNLSGLPETTPNLRMLRNFDQDITDGVINYPLRSTSCSTCKSVFSVNQQTSTPGFKVCGSGFSQPAQGQNFVKKQTSSISFKFNVSNSSGSCQNSQGTPTNLLPLLLITQTQNPDSTGLTPAPVSIPVIVAGNSGGPPTFVLSGNTWQLQVKTTDMPAGFSYLATVIDLSQTIQSFSVSFSLK